MTTRFYFHDATSSVSGTLPAATQSASTALLNYEAQTVNRSMNTTIGTAQASKTLVNSTTRAARNKFYVTKFISDPINQSGIAANTWTYNFAAKNSNLTPTDDYPCTDLAGSPIPVITCYVWRPSTGAKVGNIIDASVTGFFDTGNQQTSPAGGTLNEVVEHSTFTGAAVAGAAANDVIVFEAWTSAWLSTAASVTLSYFYDGTTANTTEATTVSNHASFLETPETITFAGGGGGGSITMTNVSILDFADHLITKV